MPYSKRLVIVTHMINLDQRESGGEKEPHHAHYLVCSRSSFKKILKSTSLVPKGLSVIDCTADHEQISTSVMIGHYDTTD